MDISQLVLIITEKCNLDCEYCYVNKSTDCIPMSESTARKAVQLLLDSAAGEKMLILSGGEPLIRYDLIRYIVKIMPHSQGHENKNRWSLSKHKGDISIGIATNGMLLTRDKLEFFMQKNVRLMISYDGPFDGTRSRRFHSKAPSGQYIAQKMALFREYKDICGIKMTVTPSNAKNTYSNFKEITRLGFAIDIQPSLGEVWTESEIDEWSVAMTAISQDYLSSYPDIKIKNFDEFLCTEEHRCSLGKAILAVLPSGDVLPCNYFLVMPKDRMQGFIIGNCNSFINYGKAKIWDRFSLPVNQRCDSCINGCNRLCFALDRRTGRMDRKVLQSSCALFHVTHSLRDAIKESLSGR